MAVQAEEQRVDWTQQPGQDLALVLVLVLVLPLPLLALALVVAALLLVGMVEGDLNTAPLPLVLVT